MTPLHFSTKESIDAHLLSIIYPNLFFLVYNSVSIVLHSLHYHKSLSKLHVCKYPPGAYLQT